MMSLLTTAFVMGGLGSFHCIGMCGPIALSLPLVAKSNLSKFISSLLYNFGRIITYSLIGAIAGLAGKTFALFGAGQWLSVVIGAMIILFVALPGRIFTKTKIFQPFFNSIRKALGHFLSDQHYYNSFMIGILNGFLPCGLLYMAIGTAVATGSIINSSLFMASFGLGTLPLMWVVAFWGSFLKLNMRHSIRKLYPYMMLLMGVLLIVRGLGLGIPYLSPAYDTACTHGKDAIQCHD